MARLNKSPQQYAVYKGHIKKHKDKKTQRIKGWKHIYYTNTKEKKANITVF